MIKKVIVSVVIFCIFLTVVGCSGLAATPTPGDTSTPDTTPTPDSTLPDTPKTSDDLSPVLPSQPPSGPIKATWIDALLEGDIVSITLAEVKENWNNNFKLETADGTYNSMAYILNGELFVRANACPPCRSIGFSLDNDILVCDRCATTFDAVTGEGIGGACVDFPKASVAYEITSTSIVMSLDDLITSYEDTIEPG
jgi:nitrite reductase/ring-hydroxylating ferredoxin subunit